MPPRIEPGPSGSARVRTASPPVAGSPTGAASGLVGRTTPDTQFDERIRAVASLEQFDATLAIIEDELPVPATLHRALIALARRIPLLDEDECVHAREAVMTAHSAIPAEAGLTFADVESGRVYGCSRPDWTEDEASMAKPVHPDHAENFVSAWRAMNAGVPFDTALQTFPQVIGEDASDWFFVAQTAHVVAHVRTGATVQMAAARQQVECDDALQLQVASDALVCRFVRGPDDAATAAARLGIAYAPAIGELGMAVSTASAIATWPALGSNPYAEGNQTRERNAAAGLYVENALADGTCTAADLISEFGFVDPVARRMLRGLEVRYKAEWAARQVDMAARIEHATTAAKTAAAAGAEAAAAAARQRFASRDNDNET